MRGKKIDNDFVSEFITNCIKSGINTPEFIMSSAQNEIAEIDEDIRRIEKMKIRRSKLLDVVNTFQQMKDKPDTEVQALSFFKIQYPNICYFICQILKQGPVEIGNIKGNYSSSDIIFCVKQLIEHKIIARSGPYLVRGAQFNDYLKVALKETI